jgi:hypothetical protein
MNYLPSHPEPHNDCIFVRSCIQNAAAVNMYLERTRFMGHVDRCYLAGVEDGYENRVTLCISRKVKKKKYHI